jgi:hypothetical protein
VARPQAFQPKNAGGMGVPGVEALEAAAACRVTCRRVPAASDRTTVGFSDSTLCAITRRTFLAVRQVVIALNLGIQQSDIPAQRGEGDINTLAEETNLMGISRKAKAAAAAAVGISALTFGLGPVSAVPLDPPPPSPAPAGPAMKPSTSTPPTTNDTHPGVGPGGAHGGQNQTQAPGS